MAKRIRQTATVLAVGALLGLSACGGGGGGSGGALPMVPPAAVGDPPPAPVPAGKIAGTFATGKAVSGTIDILAANGATLSVDADATGHFEFSVEGLDAPYVLRGKLPGGALLYAVRVALPPGGTTVTANISPLTHLAVSGLSPDGDAAKLWALSNDDRAARIQAGYAGIHQRLKDALAPLAAALKLPDGADFADTGFQADGTGIDALLDNLRTEAIAFTGGTLYSLASASSPNLRSSWLSTAGTIPALQLGTSHPPVALGPVQASIDASYNGYREGAAKFDPAKIDQAELSRVLDLLQTEAQRPEPSIDTLQDLMRQMLVALSFPDALAKEIVRQLDARDPSAALSLIASFFGPEGQAALNDVKNMQARWISTDLPGGLATYQVTIGSKTYFQSWLLSTGNTVGGQSPTRDHPECMVSRYTGSTGQAISNTQLIENSEFFNTCSFPVNYVSCIWQAGTTGPQHSGCSREQTSGSAEPGASAHKYEVLYGPLGESRVFMACAAPARPVFLGEGPSNAPALPYRVQWQCQ
ncbi:hypothetical protein [Variovorax sp. EL159]|uniref:hypothetical protein n=1 Tax=Variovorax sp. EL159 TaxID=1566270 RepID=UPI0008877A97|nr:hypothetical protein [Variovorax sp. EL159]SCX73494.1 hypothetical protein SAMN03159363_5226 [Variovorax sp. EL159]